MTKKSLQIKLLAIITVLFALATPSAWAQSGNWDSYKAASYDSGSGTADAPYIIKTAEQLAYFAARVTSGQDKTACFKLGASIDLSEHFWVPIGKATSDDGNNFSGTFDGDGNVISGMTVKWDAASGGKKNYGFFSQLRAGAKVRNIVFENAKIYNEETTTNPKAGEDRLFGVLAGMIQGSSNTEIKNIAVHNSKIEASAEFQQNGKYYVIGGFIGKIKENNDNCKIANIYVDVDIDFSKMTVNAINNVFIATFISEYQTGVKSSPTNLYVKGGIKASAALTFVGPVYGKNKPSSSTVNNTWFVESGQQYTNSNGNTLSPAFTGQAKEVTNYEQTFMETMNTYATAENLLQWKYVDSKLSFGKIVIFLLSNYDASSHISKTVEYYIKVENPEKYNYEWTVGGETKQPAFNAQGYSSFTVNLSNKTVEAQVVVTKQDDATITYTLPFTIAPKYYSIDLYADEYASGEGTKEKPYLIANDLQLAKLAREVNNSSTKANFVGKYFELSANIDLSSALWMPIGTWNNATERYFYGKFDGKGHTIENMRIEWEVYKGKWSAWGLFSRIQGNSTTEVEFGCITNLIFQDAEIQKKADYQPIGEGINIGIAAGEVYGNGELSNIIIRNSKITDNDESYTPGLNGNYRIGGVLGNIEKDVARVFNLSSDVTIKMFKNTNINSDKVYVGGGIGRINNSTQNNALNIYAANIYVHGPAIVTNNQANNKWGAVVASTNNPNTDNRGTWYYVNGISGTGTNSNYGTQKNLDDNFAKEFTNSNNMFSLNNAFDQKETWTYSSSTGFNFGNTTITIARGKADVATATTPGKGGNELYYWYLSTDQINWVKQTNENGEAIQSHDFTIPRKEYDQYVYAELVDGSSRSKNELVEAIRVTAVLQEDKSTTPSTYSVHLETNVKETGTEEGTEEDIMKYLTVTYEWKLNGEVKSTETSYKPQTALTESDKLSCHLEVKDGEWVIVKRDLFVSKTVVYLDPSNTDATTEEGRINSPNWG